MSGLTRLLNCGICCHVRRSAVTFKNKNNTRNRFAGTNSVGSVGLHNLCRNMVDTDTHPRSLSERILKLQHYWTTSEHVPGLDFDQDWDIDSMLVFVRSRLSHVPDLLTREFLTLPSKGETDNQMQNRSPSGYSFRVMQWNTLAQGLSTGTDNFVKCPIEALNWETRRLRLLEEILVTDPDIVCLQEVDHYAFTRPAMEAVGYTGIFFPKPDSPALYVDDTKGPDGCAIFVKSTKFHTVGTETVVLKDKGGKFTNQVAVICKFRPKDPKSGGQEFYVATTHLKAKNGWDKLRHEQGRYLLEYLERKVGSSPLIVTGDLNADKTEPVYNAFSTSPMGLASAYMLVTDDGEEPPYTTWKFRGDGSGVVEVCRTLDYVWYRKAQLGVSAVRRFPDKEQLGENLLPSLEYPSDHLSLCVDFTFKSL